MAESAGEGQPMIVVPWARVPRKTAQRTSDMCNEAIKKVIGEARERDGITPNADAVIFAAIRRGAREDLAGLLDEIRAVDSASYTIPRPQGHDPGE